MKSFEKIGKILTIGEKEVFNNVSKIISIAAKANVILKEMLRGNHEELALAKEMEAVKALEKESNKIALARMVVPKLVKNGYNSPFSSLAFFRFPFRIHAFKHNLNTKSRLLTTFDRLRNMHARYKTKFISLQPFLKIVATWIIAPSLSFILGIIIGLQ